MMGDTNAYFVLWPYEWCKLLMKCNDFGPLDVIYGGEHISVPSFGKVDVEDIIFPVFIHQGTLFLLGKFEIQKKCKATDYLTQNKIYPISDGLWDTECQNLLKNKPFLGHRIPRSCVLEAAIGIGSPISYSRVIPVSIIEQLKLGKKGEEKELPLKNNKVSHVNLQGHFRRLSEESVKLILELIDGSNL